MEHYKTLTDATPESLRPNLFVVMVSTCTLRDSACRPKCSVVMIKLQVYVDGAEAAAVMPTMGTFKIGRCGGSAVRGGDATMFTAPLNDSCRCRAERLYFLCAPVFAVTIPQRTVTAPLPLRRYGVIP